MKQKFLFFAALGAFVIYWAMTHSPKAGIGQISKNFFSGSYTMSEPWFYVSMAFGIVLCGFGVLKWLKVIK